MLAKSALALGSIALLAVTSFMPQGGIDGQGFTDCDLDIRPDNRPEVDVYWQEAPSGQLGLMLVLAAPSDGVLTMGFPDGTNEIPLKKGVVNTALFVYDSGRNEVTLTIANGVPADTKSGTITTVGTYDALGKRLIPTEESVRPPATGKERSRITGLNFGLEFPITVTREVKKS